MAPACRSPSPPGLSRRDARTWCRGTASEGARRFRPPPRLPPGGTRRHHRRRGLNQARGSGVIPEHWRTRPTVTLGASWLTCRAAPNLSGGVRVKEVAESEVRLWLPTRDADERFTDERVVAGIGERSAVVEDREDPLGSSVCVDELAVGTVKLLRAGTLGQDADCAVAVVGRSDVLIGVVPGIGERDASVEVRESPASVVAHGVAERAVLPRDPANDYARVMGVD